MMFRNLHSKILQRVNEKIKRLLSLHSSQNNEINYILFSILNVNLNDTKIYVHAFTFVSVTLLMFYFIKI